MTADRDPDRAVSRRADGPSRPRASRGADKTQFNVYLPPELVTAVKHRAIDEGSSLSALVERALTQYIERTER